MQGGGLATARLADQNDPPLSHRLAQPLAQFPEYQRTGNADLIRPFEQRPEYLQGLLGSGDTPAPDWEWRAKLLVSGEDEKRAIAGITAILALWAAGNYGILPVYE